MKSLCTCAALAVAIAHGSFADALAPGERAPRSAAKATTLAPLDGSANCTTAINAFRQGVDSSAAAYKELSGVTPGDDLADFFDQNNCDVLKSGAFNHIVEDPAGGGNKLFVITATRTPASDAGEKISCAEALKQWESGFSEFGGQAPGPYKDNQEAYSNGNAVGLVSLLSDKEQKIYCGTPTGCEGSGGNDTLICYFKPSGVTAETAPVTSAMWEKAEQYFKFKPKLATHDDNQGCVTAVNSLRQAEHLELPAFKVASDPKIEDALSTLTCADINNSRVDPSVVEGHTLIYAVKEGDTAPTANDAVESWESAAKELGVESPPAFTKDSDGEIYYNNAVAGFVSIMVDDEREMKCYKATGCEKAALICLLKGATLVEEKKPISDDTWKKVLAVYVEKIGFEERPDGEGCLKEINDFRAQDGLGLKAFVALEDVQASTSSAISQGVTCDALRSGNSPFMFGGDKPVSLMYYYGEPATCSAAVREWKNGIDLFKGVDIPPKYSAEEPIYKNGAATNFISLVSEADETKIKCVNVTGCKEPALLCVLQPPVFKEGVAPISEETWQKVTDTVTSGAAAASAYGALLSSVVVAVGLFALNF